MNITKFLLSTLVGGIVYFLFGWLFYGVLFTNIYPPTETERMLFIVLGSFSFAMLLAYIFNKWANINTGLTGAKAGAILGFLIALYMNFFMYSGMEIINYQNMGLDVLLGAVLGAVTGFTVALVSDKSTK